jgi:nondiscriminating glutamyl-tRNA synthetase
MKELIEKFDLNNVHKSGAVFDIDRLDFFNSNYLKKLDTNYLYDKFISYLKKFDNEFYEVLNENDIDYNKNIFNELKSRIKNFSEYKSFTTFFYNDSNIP